MISYIFFLETFLKLKNQKKNLMIYKIKDIR